MNLPNGMLALDMVITALCVGNGLLDLRRGGLVLGARPVFKIDQPQLWGAGLAFPFGMAALLAVHVAAVLIVRVGS